MEMGRKNYDSELEVLPGWAMNPGVWQGNTFVSGMPDYEGELN
jgi:hypothetical protein